MNVVELTGALIQEGLTQKQKVSFQSSREKLVNDPEWLEKQHYP